MHNPTFASLQARSLSPLLAGLSLFAVLLAALLAFWSSPACADDTPGIRLPAGQQPLALAWDSPQSVVVLCRSSQTFALYRATVGRSAVDALALPHSFMSLKPSDKVADPDFCLSPAGNGLAVLRPAAMPLKERELLLYEIRGDSLQELSERLPPGFWPELLCFKPDGSELFMSTRNFVNPEQDYSIGALQLQGGKFMGVALKQNVDVVTALEYIPQRRALAIRAGGLNGSYPLEPMMLGLDLGSMKLYMLHSDAAQLVPRPLADGGLLLYFDSALPRPSDGGASREARMNWRLTPDSWELEPANLNLDSAAPGLDASPDGAWLGFIASPLSLGVEKGSKLESLTLQRLSDARSLLTETPCSFFEFAPDSQHVCAADSPGGRLYFFALPEG